jgi:PAS domain S-box-containing protein
MILTELEFSHALDNKEFVPHFQPLVHLRTRQLQGFELLARWQHPERGLVPPDEFIPIAETQGWITQLMCDLFRKGFAAIAALPGKPMLSVNISSVQLRDRTLPAKIESLAAEAGFSPHQLIVEITESALAEDLPTARAIVSDLKDAGCRLALDDFGTGYSSLLHLQSLPFDELKVDRSFVRSMTTQRESRKIVAAIIGLGQSLGLTTVAEGVESEKQDEMLRWLGCELGQGWLYGRPVSAASLPEVVCLSNSNPPAVPSNRIPGRLSVSSLESPPGQRLAQLQAVCDGAPVGLAFIDREMRYLNLNRHLANMNGRPMEDHLGRTVAEVIPELFPSIEPYLRRALAGEAVTGVELVLPADSSNPARTIMLSYEPALDEAGEVVGISVVFVDLTPIKRAEEARRTSEEHFRHMFELIPQIPWIIDDEGRALDVSQRWLTLTGMSGDEWRGFGWLKAIHPDDLQPTRDTMKHAFATGESIDLYYRVRQSPEHPWQRLRARGSARHGEDGKIMCWYGVLELVEDAVDKPSPAG